MRGTHILTALFLGTERRLYETLPRVSFPAVFIVVLLSLIFLAWLYNNRRR